MEKTVYLRKVAINGFWCARQNSNLRPLGHEPSELTNCSNLRCVQPIFTDELHEKCMNTMNYNSWRRRRTRTPISRR